ncbi:hypothetical protein FU659_10150 [Paenibacillus sp. N3.4]|nr:hypothetical protein FU659_10150 [Paenibacillus sp. N3.4]
MRQNVIKEVRKFRSCGDPNNGFKILVCEGCHHIAECGEKSVMAIKDTGAGWNR